MLPRWRWPTRDYGRWSGPFAPSRTPWRFAPFTTGRHGGCWRTSRSACTPTSSSALSRSIAQANLDVEPGVVCEELRRIQATHIEFGSKRRMQCTVLTDTQRRLLQALEVPEPEQTPRSTA